MQILAVESQWLTPIDGSTLYVCKSQGNGTLVLNGHEKWTPILNFARAFPADYARALARRMDGAFTAERIEIL
jgi:hypothetical protein